MSCSHCRFSLTAAGSLFRSMPLHSMMLVWYDVIWVTYDVRVYDPIPGGVTPGPWGSRVLLHPVPQGMLVGGTLPWGQLLATCLAYFRLQTAGGWWGCVFCHWSLPGINFCEKYGSEVIRGWYDRDPITTLHDLSRCCDVISFELMCMSFIDFS